MKRLILVMVIALMLVPMVSISAQDEDNCQGVVFVQSWARPSPLAEGNGAAYGWLINLSDEDTTLVSATTEVAEVTELHEMKMGDGDVMMMAPVEGGIPVPAHGMTELKPGGLHIMMINLAEPLVEEMMFPVTLTFDTGQELTVTVPVHDPTMDMSEHHMEDDMAHEAMMAPTKVMLEGCTSVHVVGLWVRPAPLEGGNGAAYALLVNPTMEDDTLVSASTDAAEVTELHEMKMGEGDVMMMAPIEGGISVPSGEAVQLRPGGLHIMMINLAEPLAPGMEIELSLTFENAGEMTFTVPVMEMDAPPMDMGGEDGHMDMDGDSDEMEDATPDPMGGM